jgi:hypothetical protein
MKISVLISMFLSATTAFAMNSANLEVSEGSQTTSQEVSGQGDWNTITAKSTETRYKWDLSYTHSIVDFKDTSGQVLSDTSHTVTLGSSLRTHDNWSFGGDFNYSKTPEENLQSTGVIFSLGKRYPIKSLGDDDFDPYVGWELSAGYDNYTQTFTREVRRKAGATPRPQTGKDEILRSTGKIAVSAGPWEWLAMKVAYSKFSFNKNVNDFLQYLDVHQAIGKASSGFEDALSGFYDNTLTESIYFYLTETWEFDLEHSQSTVAADKSTATYDRATLLWDMTDKWTVSLGVEQDRSSVTTLVESTSTSIFASVGYVF